MEEIILTYLKSDKHNYHGYIKICMLFGKCFDVLLKLVEDGKVEKTEGLNDTLFKYKE